MQKSTLAFLLFITLIVTAVFSTACNSTTANTTGSTAAPGPSGVAASVNSKQIKTEEVEKLLNQNLQGQQNKLSPLELAQARLQVVDGLIQREVMYQRAERDKTLPTEDEITQVINEQKQAAALTADDYNKKLQEAGETEASLRERAKKDLAIKKLGDRIASAVEPPKDSEVEEFYKGNPAAFVRKRGASFAAIVIDPRDNGEGDTTKNEQEAQVKLGELGKRLNQPGSDFAALAREYSEDPQTNFRGGDWREFSEDEMKQFLGPQGTDFVMNKASVGQIFPQPVPLEGKVYILKITGKQAADENLTLDSPNVKQQITTLLLNARKQLLTQSYLATAMDEARIENYVARNIVSNPNGLSGARPFDPNATPAAAASPAASAAASPAASAATGGAAAAPRR